MFHHCVTGSACWALFQVGNLTLSKIASHTNARLETVDRPKNGPKLVQSAKSLKTVTHWAMNELSNVSDPLRRNYFTQWDTSLPACLCMGRYLCSEPSFPVATCMLLCLWRQHLQALCKWLGGGGGRGRKNGTLKTCDTFSFQESLKTCTKSNFAHQAKT